MNQRKFELAIVAGDLARQHNLPAPLVMAIIEEESRWNPGAWRTEPNYRYLVNCRTGEPFRKLTEEENRSEVAPKDFPYLPQISSRNSEWIGQQASWGPMQVMGAVAREYGFLGVFPELSGAKGVDFGCIHLDELRKRFIGEHGWEGVVAAYNAGSPRRRVKHGLWVNQDYVNKVSKALRRLFNIRMGDL